MSCVEQLCDQSGVRPWQAPRGQGARGQVGQDSRAALWTPGIKDLRENLSRLGRRDSVRLLWNSIFPLKMSVHEQPPPPSERFFQARDSSGREEVADAERRSDEERHSDEGPPLTAEEKAKYKAAKKAAKKKEYKARVEFEESR